GAEVRGREVDAKVADGAEELRPEQQQRQLSAGAGTQHTRGDGAGGQPKEREDPGHSQRARQAQYGGRELDARKERRLACARSGHSDSAALAAAEEPREAHAALRSYSNSCASFDRVRTAARVDPSGRGRIHTVMAKVSRSRS